MKMYTYVTLRVRLEIYSLVTEKWKSDLITLKDGIKKRDFAERHF